MRPLLQSFPWPLILVLAAVASAQTAPAPPPLSDTRLTAFAQRIEAVFNQQRDAKAAAALFDFRPVIDAAIVDIKPDPSAISQLRAGMLNAYSPARFTESVLASMGDHGTFTLLRLVDRAGQRRLLFRFEGKNFGYHELLVTAAESGQPAVVDIFAFASGEPSRELFAREMTRVMRAATAPASAPPEPIDALAIALRKRDLADAQKLLKALPTEARKLRAAQTANVAIAQQQGLNQTLAALDEYDRTFPGDPAMILTSIAVYRAASRHEPLMTAIDRLDKLVGGDPYLETMRAAALAANGKSVDAALAAARAFTADPDAYYAADALRRHALSAGDYRQVAAALRALETRHKQTFTGLSKDPQYTAFLASPEGQPWAK